MEGFSFTDRSAEWLAANHEKVDLALARYAQRIEISIKTGGKIPRKSSIMQGAVRHQKVGDLHYKVVSPQNYSAVQEKGERQGHRFQNYTTPGTGPGWFQAAIDANKETVDAELRE